jgi:hypothetical protein
MPKLHAEEADADALRHYLGKTPGLGHLRVRRRGDALILESGPEQDSIRHVRFRRDTVHLWYLDVADPGGRWERTPFRALLKDLLDVVIQQFGWLLADQF